MKKKPSQKEVIEFMENPDTIKKAVEGSMEKRLKVLNKMNYKESATILKELK